MAKGGNITYKNLETIKPAVVNDGEGSTDDGSEWEDAIETLQMLVKTKGDKKEVKKSEEATQKIEEVSLVKLGVVEFSGQKQITKSGDAEKIFREFWDEKSINVHESFNVLLLNKANMAIGIYQHSKGGIDGTVADIEMICAIAVKSLAKGVIICHNHPSGNIKPSNQDIDLTKRLKTALKLLTIELLDSLIVAPEIGVYLSLADEGEM